MAFPWVPIGIYVLNSLSKASTAKKQGAQSQAVANFNADQLEIDATRVRNKSVEDDRDLRTKYAGIKSSQRARMAAQGIFVDSGTAEQIQDDTDLMMELSSYRIRQSSEEIASSLEDKADFNRESGQVAYQAGQDQAAGAFLAGAGQVAGAWYSYANNPAGY